VIFFWLINLIPGQDIFGEFQHVFLVPQTYLVLAFIGCGLAGLDEGFQMIKRMLAYFDELAQEVVEKK
jgi:hypothetical protein